MDRVKLTREQRFLLMRGTCPRISFPADEPPPCAKGQVVRLSKNVEIQITGLMRTKKGELVVEYILRDSRPTLLRRTPQVHTPTSDSDGYVRVPDEDEVEAARLDSSYTHSRRGAIEDAGEAVPGVDQAKLTTAARLVFSRREQDREEANRKRERAVRDRLRETLKGLDPDSQNALLAALEREIQQADMSEAA